MAPDDLPGLDDDSPTEDVGTGPGEPSTTDPSSIDASRTPEPQALGWTSQELDEWFENEVGGDAGVLEEVDPDLEDPDLEDPEFEEALAAYRRLMPYDSGVIGPLMLAGSRPAWDQLSEGMKEKFRRGWERRRAAHGPSIKPVPDEPTDSLMDELEVLPPIGSLPREPRLEDPPADSVIEELAPYPPLDGGPGDEDPTSPAPGSFRWIMHGVAAIIIGFLVAITAVVAGWTGGWGGTTTTAVALAGVAPVATTTTAPVVTTTTSGVALTTTSTSTTTTAATMATASATTGAKNYSVNMPCPSAAKPSFTILLDVYITAGATNVSYSLPDPNGCADTTVSNSGKLAPKVVSPEAAEVTFRITFSLVGGAGATGGTDPVTARVTWTNP